MDVLAYRPEPAELCWTFGGVPPVRRVRPGTALELWTEDAFGGRVRGPDDLVSMVVEFPLREPADRAVLRRRGDLTVTLPLDALHSTVGVPPASFEATSSRSPDAHGGNMDTVPGTSVSGDADG